MIGKDILRFHTIYWPIFLMALGRAAPEAGIRSSVAARRRRTRCPSRTGNVIYADDLVRLFGVDAVRYYVLS